MYEGSRHTHTTSFRKQGIVSENRARLMRLVSNAYRLFNFRVCISMMNVRSLQLAVSSPYVLITQK